jgi:hypothetical protein
MAVGQVSQEEGTLKPGLLLAAVLAVGCSSTPVGIVDTVASEPSAVLAKQNGKKLGKRPQEPPDSEVCSVSVESTSVECSVRRSDPFILPVGGNEAP